MKKLLLPLGVLLAGGGVGGGGAIATRHFTRPPAPGAAAEEPLVFVPVAKVVAPLVLTTGTLSGYVAFDAELQVTEDKQADVTGKLPLLLHAINMRTYRAPLATGPDGMLPDIREVKRVVQAACVETFGQRTVRRVAITRAEPI